MGDVEELHRHFNENERLSPIELKSQIEQIKGKMVRDWQDFKRSVEILSDAEIKDNQLDMLLLYMIKRGFFD